MRICAVLRRLTVHVNRLGGRACDGRADWRAVLYLRPAPGSSLSNHSWRELTWLFRQFDRANNILNHLIGGNTLEICFRFQNHAMTKYDLTDLLYQAEC